MRPYEDVAPNNEWCLVCSLGFINCRPHAAQM
jgi:hypothetical protein